MFHNSKTTCMVYPLALSTNNIQLQPSKYRTLFHNSKRTCSVYPSALPLNPKVGFIPVNLSTSNSTRRNLQTYLQTLTGSPNVSESWKETTRKTKENSSGNVVKWRPSAKHVECAFPHVQPTPSPDLRARSLHTGFHNHAI